MRLLVALALVVVALVVVLVRIATVKPRRVVLVDEQELGSTIDEPEATIPVEPPPPPMAPARAAPAPRSRIGVAVLKGRVLRPAGSGASEESVLLSGVSVRADDGQRSFRARMWPEGRFELRLPPGRYEVLATDGDLVGLASDIDLLPERERELDIVLGPGAAIRGTVRGRTDLVTLETVPSGRGASVEGEFSDIGDTFEVGGLVPGRRYDLIFSGRGIRRTVVAGVAAPAQGIEVVLSPLAVLRGAVGFPRGETCPIQSVSFRRPSGGEEDEGDDDAEPDGDCRFVLAVPEGKAEVTVVATGPGWHLEERVSVPATGDPDPICLNPPCREKPLEDLARLRITFEPAAGGPVGEIEAMVGGRHRVVCAGTEGACEVTGLPPGTTLVTARTDGCATEARTVALAPGSNVVTFSCRRLRRIEGLVRVLGGRAAGEIVVRCRGGDTQYLSKTRLFDLRCASDVSDLEYRTEGGPWQKAPLPSGTGDALVEITL